MPGGRSNGTVAPADGRPGRSEARGGGAPRAVPPQAEADEEESARLDAPLYGTDAFRIRCDAMRAAPREGAASLQGPLV
jgi:hypothetical protein